MKILAYKALEGQVKRVCSFIGTAKLSDIDSDMVQQMVFALAEQGYSESVMTKAKIAAPMYRRNTRSMPVKRLWSIPQAISCCLSSMEIYAHLDMTQNRYIPRTMEDLKEF